MGRMHERQIGQINRTIASLYALRTALMADDAQIAAPTPRLPGVRQALLEPEQHLALEAALAGRGEVVTSAEALGMMGMKMNRAGQQACAGSLIALGWRRSRASTPDARGRRRWQYEPPAT